MPDRPLVPGEVVSISGSGFGKIAGAVYFPSIDGGTTLAPIYRWGETELQVRVPDDSGSGTVRVFKSTAEDKPVLEVQGKVAQPRAGIRNLAVRLSPPSNYRIGLAKLFASNGGVGVGGVRIVVDNSNGSPNGPYFLLTEPDGTGSYLVRTYTNDYYGTVSAGNIFVMLDRSSWFEGFPHGAVAVADTTTLTSATTRLAVRVHLKAPDSTPRPNQIVLVSTNECGGSAQASESPLMTDSDGFAQGTVACPQPMAGVIAVQALAPEMDDLLTLEVAG